MNELERRFEVTHKDLVKEKSLRYGVIAAPFLLSSLPAIVLFVLGFVFGATPPVAALFFFFSLITLIGGFLIGLGVSGGLMYYRSKWMARVRERIAVDGIKAEEIDWFKHELTTSEKKSLKEVESRDLLLGDAFRDSLAARLTATRIKKSASRELVAVKHRQTKIKYLKSEKAGELMKDVVEDIDKLEKIRVEADAMKIEAEARLQMIEGAARRGRDHADTELQLKKLSARTRELPLALEAAKQTAQLEAEILKELDAEDAAEL